MPRFEVNICRKEDAEEFLKSIATKNGTEFKAPRKEKVRQKYSRNRFNCGRRVIPMSGHTMQVE